MSKQQTGILVDGTAIRIVQENSEDFMSLTDIARRISDQTDIVIQNWIRTRQTIDFLGVWESIHNAENFNQIQFEKIRSFSGSGAFVLMAKDWIESTGAIGITIRTGRNDGIFAHRDIAFEFLSFLNPAFKVYVIKEFQRLKTLETINRGDELNWNLRRELARVNYRLHTDAVQKHLIGPREIRASSEGVVYANEADLLNLALFGMTAREWAAMNPEAHGNLRDWASAEELLVLANLENLNAEYLKNGVPQDERLARLTEAAIYQLRLLAGFAQNLLTGKRSNSTEIE